MLEAMKIKFQKQKSISDKYYREAIADWNELGITKNSFKKLFLILLKITLFIVGVSFLYIFGWIYILGIVMLIFSGLSILKLIF